MKRRLPLILWACLGALVFFSTGVFTGQHWSGRDKVPDAGEQRSRASAKFLPAPPVEKRLSPEPPQTVDPWGGLTPEEHVEELEKKVAVLVTQFESIRDLADDKLIIAVRALNLPNVSVNALYSQYVEETAALEEASQSGYGQRHPKILALNASLDIKYAQLLEASESLKRDLEVQLKGTRKILEAGRSALRTQDAGNIRHARSSRARSTAQIEQYVKINVKTPRGEEAKAEPAN